MKSLPVSITLMTILGCTTAPTPKQVKQPKAVKKQVKTPILKTKQQIRTIATIKWQDTLGVHLLGVDKKNKLAYLQLKQRTPPYKMHIEAYDLKSGERKMQWQASPNLSKKMVTGYPRFVGFGPNFASDLSRYSTMLRQLGPWSHREATAPMGVSASPDGQRILYTVPPTNGRDGDWLMLASGEGKKSRRFARSVLASYRTNFSPDSSKVAWIGGQTKYARPGKRVGYVLHTADFKGTIKTYPAIRDLLRTPQWTQKSDALFALGQSKTNNGTKKQCLHYVNVQTQKTQTLHCHEGDMEFILNAKDQQLLIMEHPNQPNKMRTIRFFDTKTLKNTANYKVPTPLGFGAFGYFISSSHVALFTHGGQKITVIETTSGKTKKIVEVAPQGAYAGRHTSQQVDGELILLHHRKNKVQLIGVQLLN